MGQTKMAAHRRLAAILLVSAIAAFSACSSVVPTVATPSGAVATPSASVTASTASPDPYVPTSQAAGPRATWKVVSKIDIPGSGFIHLADGLLWVMDRHDGELDANGRPLGSLYAIDPLQSRVAFRIRHVVGDCPVVAYEAIWLCTTAGGLDSVTHIDLATHHANLLKTSDAASPEPEAICPGTRGHLWVSNHAVGTVARLDATTGQVQRTVDMSDRTGEAPRGKCASMRDSVWMVLSSTGQLLRFDARTGGEIGRIDIPTPSGEPWLDGVIEAGGYLFIPSRNAVQKVVPAVVPAVSGRADRLVANLTFNDADSEHDYVASDGQALWLARSQANRLYRVDPESFTVTGYVDLPAEPVGVSAAGNYVWVRTEGQVLQLAVPTGPAGVPGAFDSWRPAQVVGAADLRSVDESVHLVRFGGHYFAIGSGYSPQVDGQPVDAFVWASADGARWVRKADGPRGMVFDVAADAERMVAVGDDEIGYAGMARTWVTQDGITWDEVEGVPPLIQMAAWNHGFIGATSDESGTSEIWTSPDGMAWTKAVGAEEFGGQVMRLRVIDTIEGEPLAIAVGLVNQSNGSYVPQIWWATLANLSTWHPWERPIVTDPSVLVEDVAERDGKYLAVGFIGYCCGFTSYSSQDGRKWDPVSSNLDDESPIAADWLLATPEGFILVGRVGGETQTAPAMWTSPTGEHWRQIELRLQPGSHHPRTFDLGDGGVLAREDGSLIVVGSIGDNFVGWVVR